MTYRVYSGPPGTEAVPPLEKERWLYKEFGLLDEALGWARHVNDGGRVTLLIEGDDGTRLTKTEISAALRHPEEVDRKIETAATPLSHLECLCGLEGVWPPHLPLMALAADGAAREHVVFSDAQQRFEFAVDPDIDVLPGAWGRRNAAVPWRPPCSSRLRWSECVSLSWHDGRSSNFAKATRSQCGER